jgi:hypothetical protein
MERVTELGTAELRLRLSRLRARCVTPRRFGHGSRPNLGRTLSDLAHSPVDNNRLGIAFGRLLPGDQVKHGSSRSLARDPRVSLRLPSRVTLLGFENISEGFGGTSICSRNRTACNNRGERNRRKDLTGAQCRMRICVPNRHVFWRRKVASLRGLPSWENKTGSRRPWNQQLRPCRLVKSSSPNLEIRSYLSPGQDKAGGRGV